MFKKLIIGSLLIFSSSLFGDELSGDTKYSCEAILCLSTGSRPSECSPSLNKYFSISAKKWKDTIAKRKSFLQLCPVGTSSEKDVEFTKLRDNIILNVTAPCDAEELNRTELMDEDYSSSQIRINPTLTDSCKLLKSSSYTDINVVYTCNPNAWYSFKDWNNGYTTTSINANQYKSLSSSEKKEYSIVSDDDGNSFWNSYSKQTPIKKDCWEVK